MRGFGRVVPLVSAVLFFSTMGPAVAEPGAPDGGPWAPVLFDPGSVVVQPREIEPGQDVHVTFSFRTGQAQRIEKLELTSRSSLLEIDVTQNLDRETGVCEFTIPGKSLGMPGQYELRMDMTFVWEDSKSYHRSPPFGALTIRRFAGQRYTPETLSDDLALLADEVREATAKLAAVDGAEVADLVLPDIGRTATEVRELVDSGDHPAAKYRLVETLRQVREIAADPLRAAYDGRVARYVAGIEPAKDHPVMSILTGGAPEYTEDDYRIFRELGIKVVAWRHPGDVAKLHERGFECVSSRAPVRLTEGWLAKHPEDRQHRYLLSDPTVANGDVISLDPLNGFLEEHYELDTGGDAGRYWRVLDATTGVVLPAAQWQYDDNNRRVVVHDAASDHAYRVVTLVQSRNIPFFGRLGDPLYPGCMTHILRRLDTMFSEQEGLDVYRPTSLFYPFPKIEKWHSSTDGRRRMLSWHNFYGYQWGTSPLAQRLFAERTGIPFDPMWMVDGGRYGDINYPPQPGYLKWMEFQQENVTKFTKQVVDVAHRHGARTRVFWGDHWIGMEPHANQGRFFAATGMDEIVKACGSAVVVRMTVDIPADVTKVIRFSPWFSWGELFSRTNPPSFMEHRWGDIKRGALFRMPDGLTWGGETQTAGFAQPRIVSKMRSIANEFRTMYDLLGREEVYHHDLNVYVLNAWGDVRPWAGWLQINESQMILTHLTDLPVRVRFLSLAEVASKGVPDDADVLINVGEPHSSWSGGFHWTAETVEAVEGFVAKGGGLIGIGAPSHFRRGEHTWQLAPVLGVDFADSVRKGEGDAGSFSKYDSAFLDRGPKPSQERPMVRVGPPHFITEQLADRSEPVLCKVQPEVISDDVQVLCSGDGKTDTAPLVTSRIHKAGRAVYINGYSSEHDYGRMLRRAIFWTAGRESLYDTLVADQDGVMTYLYPIKRLLVVYNQTREAVSATVHLDAKLLGIEADSQVRLTDLLSGEVETTSVAQLRRGISRTLPAHANAFLRVDTVR